MKRRRFGALATAAFTGISGCTAAETRNFIRNRTDVVESEDWRVFNAGFDRIEWDGTDLVVHFEPNHGMDFFQVSHEYNRADYEVSLYSDEAPEFDGTVRVPFVELRQRSDREFPSQVFALSAYEGEYGSLSLVEEELGSVTFRVPDRVWNSRIIRG